MPIESRRRPHPTPLPLRRASRVTPARGRTRVDQRFLLVLLLLFAAKGVILTFVFPAFSGHDEVAHYARGLVLGIAAIVAAPWYLYMLRTYGSISALDRILKLQWWNNQDGVTRSITDQLFDRDFAWMR